MSEISSIYIIVYCIVSHKNTQTNPLNVPAEVFNVHNKLCTQIIIYPSNKMSVYF